MRLTLKDAKAFFSHLNTRSERHGEGYESAADFDFSIEVPNLVLRKEMAGARVELENGETLLSAHCFHDTANPGKDLADVGMEENPDYLPHLRFAWAKTPHFVSTGEMLGARLVVHHGIGGASDLIVEGVKVSKLEGTFKAGGTLALEFQVQGKPDKESLAELYEKIKHEVSVTLLPPEATLDLLAGAGGGAAT